MEYVNCNRHRLQMRAWNLKYFVLGFCTHGYNAIVYIHRIPIRTHGTFEWIHCKFHHIIEHYLILVNLQNA
jgi:hypothetical protein